MAIVLRTILLSSLLALAACAAEAGGDPPAPASEKLRPMPRMPETPPAKSALPGEAIPVDAVPKILRDAVLKDAASKATAGTITSARKVTWNDGSMGCPQPGMMYTQALISGYWLVVSAGDQRLEYHTDERRNFLRCEQALSPRAQREDPADKPVAPPQPSDPKTRPKTPDT
ncbi:MAG TPA: hypothetical protein P5528_00290 [Steroidobacteraceae bacterium]|nr:hypothetical protein [Steroidobacteraceae bacterium]HRX87856.1 hypothetical protein [Steroidobacteraceae bacterium]